MRSVSRVVWILDLEYRPRPFKYGGGAAVSEHGEVLQLRDLSDLTSWIQCEDRRLVFAHWGSRADYPIVLSQAETVGMRAVGGLYVDGGLSRFHLGRSEYRDSIRLIPRSLVDIAGRLGMEKASLPYESLFSVPLSQRIAAAENHATILLRALQRLGEIYGYALKDLPLSIGALGCLDMQRMIGREWPKCGDEGTRWGDLGRYGGRTELFLPGSHASCCVYDRIGAYSAGCEDGELPAAEEIACRNLDQADVVCAEVEIPECDIPVLPMRHHGFLFFPTGPLFGYWTGEELRYAVECGVKVRKIEAGVRYLDRVDLGPWARAHFTARTEDPFRELIEKQLANKAIGKLQQHRPLTVVSGAKMPTSGVELGHGYWSMTLNADKRPRFQNLPASAVIQARCRIALHRAMVSTVDVIHCHTDGYAVPHTIADVGTDLGEWRLKQSGHLRAIAPGAYVLHDGVRYSKYTLSGITGGRDHHLGGELAERVIQGEEVEIEAVATQKQIWSREALDMSEPVNVSLHLDAQKRCYCDRGSSLPELTRPWTTEEIVRGDWDSPFEDRHVIDDIERILRKGGTH